MPSPRQLSAIQTMNHGSGSACCSQAPVERKPPQTVHEMTTHTACRMNDGFEAAADAGTVGGSFVVMSDAGSTGEGGVAPEAVVSESRSINSRLSSINRLRNCRMARCYTQTRRNASATRNRPTCFPKFKTKQAGAPITLNSESAQLTIQKPFRSWQRASK